MSEILYNIKLEIAQIPSLHGRLNDYRKLPSTPNSNR